MQGTCVLLFHLQKFGYLVFLKKKLELKVSKTTPICNSNFKKKIQQNILSSLRPGVTTCLFSHLRHFVNGVIPLANRSLQDQEKDKVLCLSISSSSTLKYRISGIKMLLSSASFSSKETCNNVCLNTKRFDVLYNGLTQFSFLKVEFVPACFHTNNQEYTV